MRTDRRRYGKTRANTLIALFLALVLLNAGVAAILVWRISVARGEAEEVKAKNAAESERLGRLEEELSSLRTRLEEQGIELEAREGNLSAKEQEQAIQEAELISRDEELKQREESLNEWEERLQSQDPDEKQRPEPVTSNEPVNPPPVPTFDASGQLAESARVDRSYFDDAVFVGNSLIVGFSHSSGLNATYYATVGMNVTQFFSKESFEAEDGSYLSCSAMLERTNYSKIYLMFGINELGFGSASVFIYYYDQIIDYLKELNPQARIYVQSILPLNTPKWQTCSYYSDYVNNYNIASYNQALVNMCKEKGVAFVNVGEKFTGPDGDMFSDATSDGLHVNASYMPVWVDYLCCHTY